MIEADVTYINGNIYTMEKENCKVEAMVVFDGKILFAGSYEEARKIPTKQTVNLQGKTVIPGFTDTHCHLAGMVEMTQHINLGSATSIDEALSLLIEKDKTLSGDAWLIADNFHIDRVMEKRFLFREDLDLVSKERPIAVSSYCGHATMVNSKALYIAGIGNGFVAKSGMFVDLDEKGDPNGILREKAFREYFVPKMPPLFGGDFELTKNSLERVIEDCLKKGITTIHTFSASKGDIFTTLNIFQELEKEERLKAHIVANLSKNLPNEIGASTGLGNEKVKYGALKLFVDGSMSSHSAALIEPYTNEPDCKGKLIYSPEELALQVKMGYDNNMEVAVHVIGDYGMELVLNAIEKVYNPNKKIKTRFRLIHSMLVTKEQIERIKKLPIILDVQPCFLLNWFDFALENLGEERCKLFFPFRTFIDNKIRITGGSDCPIETNNPLVGIQCAVTRKSPYKENSEPFEPQECISVYEAVSMFTKNASYCTNEEKIKGTIERGKLADFIVLDRDIFTVNQNDIYKINIIGTYVQGKNVYNK